MSLEVLENLQLAWTLTQKPPPDPRSLSRLLDVSVVPAGRSLDLTLVLEYVDQDLSTYLSKVPASGLSRDAIKVILSYL